MAFSSDLRILWDFAADKKLTSRRGPVPVSGITASVGRTSEATYYDVSGILRTADVNEARFDHDPSTGQSLGLLLEASGTNFLQESEVLDDLYWTQSNLTINVGAAIAPDGQPTASQIVEDGTTDERFIGRATTNADQQDVNAASIFVKQDVGVRHVALVIQDAGATNRVIQKFDLTNGTVGNLEIVGTATFEDADIQALPNGYYRCSVVGTPSGVAGNSGALFYMTDDPSVAGLSYTGDGTSSLIAWGTQLENEIMPTSYIKTVGSGDEIRAPDVEVGTINTYGANPAGLCLYIDVRLPNAFQSQTATLVALGDELTDAISFDIVTDESGRLDYRKVGPGNDADLSIAGGIYDGANHRHAITITQDDMIASRDGVLSARDTSVDTFASITKLQLRSTPEVPVSWMAEVRLYDTFFADSRLQDLTNGLIDEVPPLATPQVTGTYSPDLTLAYNFAEDQTLAARNSLGPTLDFTRADSATHYDNTGTLVTAVPGQPRFDYDPATGKSLGLLIEDASTNETPESENFSVWPVGSALVTSDVAIAPDGNLTADQLVDASAAATAARIYDLVIFTSASETWTFSCYIGKDSVRAAERFTRILLSFRGTNNQGAALHLDTSSGAFAVVEEVQPGSPASFSGTVVEETPGYWRVSVTATSSSSNTQIRIAVYPAWDQGTLGQTGGDATVQGDAIFWGAQLEESPVPTSYIPTSGAAVSRAAEDCTTTDVSWFNAAGDGTFHTELRNDAPASNNEILFHVGTGGFNDFIDIFTTGALGTNVRVRDTVGGSGTSTSGAAVRNQGVVHNAFGYGTGTNVANYVRGVTPFSEDPSPNPLPNVINTLYLGRFYDGTLRPTRLWTKQLRYYNTRRNDTDLDLLSRGLLFEPQREYSSDLTLLYKFAEDGNLDGEGNGQYGPTLTFARNGEASYYDYNGQIRYVPTDTPRFDHDPVTLEPLGLLVEDASRNDCPQSSTFVDATWLQFAGPVVTDNTDAAPDGSLSAGTLEDNSAGNVASIENRPFVAGDNETWCVSVYVEKDSVPASTRAIAIGLNFVDGTNTNVRLIVDTQSGAFVTRAPTAGGTLELADVQDFGAWWRLVLVMTNDATGNTSVGLQIWPAWATSLTTVADPAATGSIVLWGAQIEESPIPTSYIRTSGSAVTRGRDNVSTSDTSWYIANDPLTFYCDVISVPSDISGSGKEARHLEFGNNTSVRYWLYRGGQEVRWRLNNAGLQHLLPLTVDSAAGTIIAAAADTNDPRMYVDGAASGTDASVTLPGAITGFFIGRGVQDTSAETPFRSHFKEVRHYNTRRPDTGDDSLDELSQGLIDEPRQIIIVGNRYQMII